MMPLGALLWLVGCYQLDGLVIPNHPSDAYDLSSEVIPAELIEEVSFTSADGTTLYGAWARQPTAGKPPLIYVHGNGGPFDEDWARVELYWSWGEYDVFAFDYRGYGKSDGPATRDGILEEDGFAAAEYVAAESGFGMDQAVWICLSLGASVCAHTHDEITARAVVLESMFASTDLLLDEGTGLDLPTGWFFREPFDNLEAVSRINTPLLVIHGLEDDFTNQAFGPEVYEAAPEPKWLWQPPGVAHSDIYTVMPETYSEVVRAFFAAPTADPLAGE